MLVFPTAEQLVQAHDAILARTGGQPGLRDRGALEGALGAVEQGVQYEGGTVPQVAARLAGRVAKAHAFADGNKRASVAIWNLTLLLNGWRSGADADTLARAAIAGAVEGITPFAALENSCLPDPVFDRLMAYDRGDWA